MTLSERRSSMNRFAGCRSILFVPADRPDRFAKALASGADAVCIDLEDAVAPARKEAGRAGLRALLAGRRDGQVPRTRERGDHQLRAPEQRRPRLVVRINDPASEDGRLDAALLSEGPEGRRPASQPATSQPTTSQPDTARPGIDAAMIPKLRTRQGLRRAAEMLPEGLALLPMIETAAGLENAVEIGGGATADGTSSPGSVASPAGSVASLADSVAGLVFGGFDLLLELGAEPGWESLLYARSRVVNAASMAGVPAFDMPSRDVQGELAGIHDEAEQARRLGLTGPLGRWRELLLWEEADRARRLGFSGKTVIHPAQLSAVHRAFTPSDDAVAAAQRVVAADRDAGGGPVVLDGRMVDRPIVEAARRTLAKSPAERSSGGS